MLTQGASQIDTAWLWPYSATRQKTARSWSTQIDLMNRYHEFTFVASQAQQFAWLEKVRSRLDTLFREFAVLMLEFLRRTTLFCSKRSRERSLVDSSSRSEDAGSSALPAVPAPRTPAPNARSFTRCDTNMPSGEALCRQFLYGQRYYKSRFGQYTRTFW